MPQPINYLSLIPQPNLTGAVTGLAQALNQRSERKASLAATEQYKKDLEGAFNSGRAEDFSALIAKYPQQREAFKTSWDILDASQKDAEFNDSAKLYNALENDRDIAKSIIEERIIATENSGGDTAPLMAMKSAVDINPSMLKNQIAFTLSSVDPDKWAKISTELRKRKLEPSIMKESEAKAQKAAVEAKFAESNAAIDLEKKGWDITKIQNDIGIQKQNTKIAALNAKLNKETNDLKRQELQQKIDDAQLKREQVAREKTAEIQSLRAGIDNSLSVIDRLVANPSLDSVLGSVQGAKYFPTTAVALVTPGMDSEEVSDALADIETIQSQQFLNNLMDAKQKGAAFGSLTEKEGDRLIGYVRNLNTSQSEKQFKDNLSEIQRLLLKSRKSLADKYGVPETIPDTPEVETSPEDIDAILKKYRD